MAPCCVCYYYSNNYKCRLKKLELDFILDGVALSKQANDEVGRTQPTLNIGIPQYSAITDPGCRHYFRSTTVVKKSKKDSHTVFMQNSEAQKYLEDRKKIGAGKMGQILIVL